jgi:hypothetical protein
LWLDWEQVDFPPKRTVRRVKKMKLLKCALHKQIVHSFAEHKPPARDTRSLLEDLGSGGTDGITW